MLRFDEEMMINMDTDTINHIIIKEGFKLHKIYSENNGIIRMIYNKYGYANEDLDMIMFEYRIYIKNNQVIKVEYEETNLFIY